MIPNFKVILHRPSLGSLCLCGVLAALSLLDAIAPSPAMAFSVDFDDTETNYRTYTHAPNPDELYAYGESAAVRALGDGDATTNVELWYTGEQVGRAVSFVATAGKQRVRVSSVTDADWEHYGKDWIAGVLAQYRPFEQAWLSLSDPAQRVFENTFRHMGLGDPNITEFSLAPSGAMRLQMAGFYDFRSTLKQRAAQYRTQQEQMAQLAIAPPAQKQLVATQLGLSLSQLETKIKESVVVIEGVEALIRAADELTTPLQVSEVAKIEIYQDGELTDTEYAYTFDLSESGITAQDDGESYSGLADWSLAGAGSGGASGVPEPSFLLGAIAAGTLWRAAKRRQVSR